MNSLGALALRNVSRRTGRTWMTAAVLAISIGALSVRHAVTEAITALTRRMVMETRTGTVTVRPAGTTDAVNLDAPPLTDDAWLDLAGRTPGVRDVAPRLISSALLSDGRTDTPVVVRGIDSERERRVCPEAPREIATPGRWLSPGAAREIILGHALAEALGLGLGDNVTLTAQSKDGRANALSFTVVGVSTSGLPLENRRVVMIPLSSAKELLAVERGATELALRTDEPLEPVRALLKQSLGPGAEVLSWQEVQPLARDMIARQERIDSLATWILSLVVVAALLVLGLLGADDRTREIGTMLAFGLRQRSVAQLFFFEGVLLGLLGGALGVAFSFAACAAISRTGIPLNHMGTAYEVVVRPVLTWPTALLSAGWSLSVAVLASTGAAWNASRVTPIRALSQASRG